MKKSYTLHDLPQEERPRERLRKVGVDNLSLQELLALIIERGKKGENVLTIAQNLLSHFGSLTRIKGASIEELQKVKGIGFATACKLKAAFKLGEKTLAKPKRYGQKIETPKDIYELFKNELGDKKKEHFKILSLTSRNRIISIDDISIGTLTASLAHPREIFYPAIKN
jgi:DNA repair protein RadC